MLIVVRVSSFNPRWHCVDQRLGCDSGRAAVCLGRLQGPADAREQRGQAQRPCSMYAACPHMLEAVGGTIAAFSAVCHSSILQAAWNGPSSMICTGTGQKGSQQNSDATADAAHLLMQVCLEYLVALLRAHSLLSLPDGARL